MPPYKNLAIIALVASSASSALSAPTRQSQEQSRGEPEERKNMELLERLESNVALHAVPAFSMRSFGGSSKRATEAPESRAIAESEGRGRNLMKAGAAGGALAVAGVAGYFIYRAAKGQVDYEKNQRDVSPAQMNPVSDALGERADVPLEDSGATLRLLGRALNEFD